MIIIERPRWNADRNEPSREQLAEAINVLRRELGKPETDFIRNKTNFGKLFLALASERAEYERAIRYGTRMAEWWIEDSKVWHSVSVDQIKQWLSEASKKENKKMAKDKKRERSEKKQDQTPPPAPEETLPEPDAEETPEPVAAMTDRRAVEILFAVTQDPKDIPEDISEWDDEGCANELKENIGLLESNDANVIKERFPEEAEAALARFAELGFVVPEPKPAAESKKGKDKTGPKKEKAEKPAGEKRKGGPGPKAGGPDGPGVIGSIQEFLTASGKKGISEDQILAKLSERFPDRDPVAMKKTIRAQLPGRMAKEKGLKIETKTEKDVKLFFVAA